MAAFVIPAPPPSLGLIREKVQFNEYALNASAHRQIADEWSLGAQYRLAYARLKRSFPDYLGIGPVPINEGVDDRSDWRGLLHTLRLSGIYRHPSGLFAQGDGILFAQQRERDGFRTDVSQPDPRLSLPADTFWQANFVAGFRFPRQKAEVAVGVLNIFDRDYRLDPINQHVDPPRSRTFYARLLINF